MSYSPPPFFFDALRPRLFELAASPQAQALLETSASEAQFLQAALDYIRAAKKTEAPPCDWLVQIDRDPYDSAPIMLSPLSALCSRFAPGEGRALGARALIEAGCSFWPRPQGLASYRPDRLIPQITRIASAFIVHAPDRALARSLLISALSDPSVSSDFLAALGSCYQELAQRSSTLLPGVLGPADERVKTLCSLLIELEPEIALASRRSGRSMLGPILADAKQRVALKSQPAPFDLDALRREQIEGFAAETLALAELMKASWSDPAPILAALERSDWLKERPQLACLTLPDPVPAPNLLCRALRGEEPSVIEWLENAGSNIWLSCAQAECPDAPAWALQQISPSFSPRAIASVARMLISGSWVLGPDGSARCLQLAAEHARSCDPLDDPEWAEAAQSLLSCAEAAAIEQSLPARRAGSPARSLSL